MRLIWVVAVATLVAGASSLVFSGAEAAERGGSSLRRPIVTGCLGECGTKDQSCLTDCEVCVENHRCSVVHLGCHSCLRAARASRRKSEEKGRGPVNDSGGIPLIREGIRVHLQHAQLRAFDSHRALRKARDGIIKAQRDAEWASQERREAVARLHKVRLGLKDAESDVVKWELKHAKKMQAMRAKTSENRLARQRAKKRLKDAKDDLREAMTQQQHRDAGDEAEDQHRDQVATAVDAEWERRRQVEEKQQAVVHAENDLRKVRNDADWLDRGLQKDVHKARARAKRTLQDLHTARAMERVTRQELEAAKRDYLRLAATTQRHDKARERLETKLQNQPMLTVSAANGVNLAATDRSLGQRPQMQPVVVVAAMLTAPFACWA